MMARGHVLIAVLVVMGALASIWMAEFATHLEDRVRASRMIDRESLSTQASVAEWQAVSTHLAGLDSTESPAEIVYSVDDVLGLRQVTLTAEWIDGQWALTRDKVQWRELTVFP